MKYFLSVPFSSRVDADGAVNADYRAVMEDLASYIRSAGHECFLALEHAGWKMGGDMNPEQELQYDFEQIDSSDAMITLLEERVSAGVQLENGYAYAKGKKIALYQIGKPAWSNMAFAKIIGEGIEQVADEAEFADRVKILIRQS